MASGACSSRVPPTWRPPVTRLGISRSEGSPPRPHEELGGLGQFLLRTLGQHDVGAAQGPGDGGGGEGGRQRGDRPPGTLGPQVGHRHPGGRLDHLQPAAGEEDVPRPGERVPLLPGKVRHAVGGVDAGGQQGSCGPSEHRCEPPWNAAKSRSAMPAGCPQPPREEWQFGLDSGQAASPCQPVGRHVNGPGGGENRNLRIRRRGCPAPGERPFAGVPRGPAVSRRAGRPARGPVAPAPVSLVTSGY